MYFTSSAGAVPLHFPQRRRMGKNRYNKTVRNGHGELEIRRRDNNHTLCDFILDTKQLMEPRVYFGLQFQGMQSIRVGKARCNEQETAGHIAPTVRKQTKRTESLKVHSQ